jgi:hypothetical protein
LVEGCLGWQRDSRMKKRFLQKLLLGGAFSEGESELIIYVIRVMDMSLNFILQLNILQKKLI